MPSRLRRDMDRLTGPPVPPTPPPTGAGAYTGSGTNCITQGGVPCAGFAQGTANGQGNGLATGAGYSYTVNGLGVNQAGSGGWVSDQAGIAARGQGGARRAGHRGRLPGRHSTHTAVPPTHMRPSCCHASRLQANSQGTGVGAVGGGSVGSGQNTANNLWAANTPSFGSSNQGSNFFNNFGSNFGSNFGNFPG